MSWVSFDLNTLWRLSKRWYSPSYHTVQKSHVTRVKELWSRTQCCNVFHERMFAQVFLKFRDLSPCRKCRKIITVSEYRSQYESKHCAASFVPYIARLSMAIPDGRGGSPCPYSSFSSSPEQPFVKTQRVPNRSESLLFHGSVLARRVHVHLLHVLDFQVHCFFT